MGDWIDELAQKAKITSAHSALILEKGWGLWDKLKIQLKEDSERLNAVRELKSYHCSISVDPKDGCFVLTKLNNQVKFVLRPKITEGEILLEKGLNINFVSPETGPKFQLESTEPLRIIVDSDNVLLLSWRKEPHSVPAVSKIILELLKETE